MLQLIYRILWMLSEDDTMVKGLLNALLDDITLLGTTVGQPTTEAIVLDVALDAIERTVSHTRERRRRP
jgi:hypothetical protein